LARAPGEITAGEILAAVELSLFEETADTVSEKAPEIEKAMHLALFRVLDGGINEVLGRVTLEDLALAAEGYKPGEEMMFFI